MICVTGHRPDKLGGYDRTSRERLERFASNLLEARQPTGVITGMAQGWDQAVATACVALKIPFLAFIPFPAHAHSARWPAEARSRYESLLGHADMVYPCSDEIPISHHQAARMMQRRNEKMVDRADDGVEALWNGTGGGTFNCIDYAQRRGVEVRNHWAVWCADPALWQMLI